MPLRAVLPILVLAGACAGEPTCDAETCAEVCAELEASATEVPKGGTALTRYEASRLGESLEAVRAGVRLVDPGVMLCRGEIACDEPVGLGPVGMLTSGRYVIVANVVAPSVGTWELHATLDCEDPEGLHEVDERSIKLRGGPQPQSWVPFQFVLNTLYKRDRSCSWKVTATSPETLRWEHGGSFLWPRVRDKNKLDPGPVSAP